MKELKKSSGFTLVEAMVSVAVFSIFAVGIFSAIFFVYKTVYQSRMRILETSILSDEIELVKNMDYDLIGTDTAVPYGILKTSKIINRNGANFVVTTTVRFVDDPYDGTSTSTPADTNPDDYKMVEMIANCVGCNPLTPLTYSTFFTSPYSDLNSSFGSLFIYVTDADGQPVSGADISIVNNSTTPAINMGVVSDSEGWYRLLNTPTGTFSYNLHVTKNGYSSDYTVKPSVSNPNPVLPPRSVSSHNVTLASFAIDRIGGIQFKTLNSSCAVAGGGVFSMRGEKLIGASPAVYKYNSTLTTNASGDLQLNNVEWDTYYLNSTGSTYDVAGTIPMSPFQFLPGGNETVYVIVANHTPYSLLVKVKDASTGLPIPAAKVSLTGGALNASTITDLGYFNQTDWSGGGGQVAYTNLNKYYSDDGKIENNKPSGDLKLRKVGQYYLSDGLLESSTIDLIDGVNFSNILVYPSSQPTSTGSGAVLLQIATSNSSTPSSWSFRGPDGTASSYYTPTSTIIFDGEDGHRYLRYRVYLHTNNTSYTPIVSDVSFTYSNGCVPPGQAYFNNFASSTYTLTVSKDGYATSTGSILVNGNLVTTVNLSP